MPQRSQVSKAWQECLVYQQPAPAVHWNAGFAQAAQGHANYLNRHQIHGHDQMPNQKGFTGRTPVDRAAAGVPFLNLGENAVTSTIHHYHAVRAFYIDWGRGPDGLLPGRGHRLTLMNPKLSEVGIGVTRSSRSLSMVQVLAPSAGTIGYS